MEIFKEFYYKLVIQTVIVISIEVFETQFETLESGTRLWIEITLTR